MVRTYEGEFRNAILMCVDDATLVGAPRKMMFGAPGVLQQPDSVISDYAGYTYLFPNQPVRLGRGTGDERSPGSLLDNRFSRIRRELAA